MIDIIVWTAIVGIGILLACGAFVAYLFYKTEFEDEEYAHESGYIDNEEDIFDETKNTH